MYEKGEKEEEHCAKWYNDGTNKVNHLKENIEDFIKPNLQV